MQLTDGAEVLLADGKRGRIVGDVKTHEGWKWVYVQGEPNPTPVKVRYLKYVRPTTPG